MNPATSEPPAILVIGRPGDPRVGALGSLAARSGRTYAVREAGTPEGDAALADVGQDGSVLPVVRLAGGPVLLDPQDLDLIDELGFGRAPAHTVAEVAVIGAGVAGLAAAVGTATRRLRTVVIDPSLPGGSLDPDGEIADQLGFPGGVGVHRLVVQATTQALAAGVRFLLTERAEQILNRDNALLLVLTSGATVACRAVVVAVGSNPSPSPDPAFDEGLPGVFTAATSADDPVPVAIGAGAASGARATAYLAADAGSSED